MKDEFFWIVFMFIKIIYFEKISTLELRLKRRSLCIETKMENRQSRRKKFCSDKIGKVRFVEELEFYKIVQDHIFRKRIKTW